ncbi:MAG: hypothetical protein GY847_01605 [Proteobacteria bacterium]|nr:hypothetical protein [Pseudomonadota bacterium]
MRQRARVLIDQGQGPGQRVAIELQQEMEFIALSRDDVLFLMKVPDQYLIDELRSRGYETEGNRIQLPDIREIAAAVVKYLAMEKISFKDFRRRLMGCLYEEYGSQTAVARVTGVSARVMNYVIGQYRTEKGMNNEPKTNDVESDY